MYGEDKSINDLPI